MQKIKAEFFTDKKGEQSMLIPIYSVERPVLNLKPIDNLWIELAAERSCFAR